MTEIAGVLLHEISHNVGYTHPEVDPSRLTIPYFLGDTAEKDLGGTVKPVGDRVRPDRVNQLPGGVTPRGKSPSSRFPRSGN